MKFVYPSLLAIGVLFVAFAPIRKINYTEETTASPDAGIKFYQGSYKSALQEAKKQNKLVFIDAYTTWCGPCKLLKKKTFPNEEAGKFFNENFVNLAIDIEQGEGVGIASKFQVSSIPTLIVTDANGNHVATSVGYIGPDQLISFGKKALKKAGR